MLALVSVPPAASAAEKMSLQLGGYYRVYAVAGRMDDDPGEAGAGFREHGIARESEIYFQGSTMLANGIRAGVTVELEGETSGDQIDESFIWFDGAFGRIELGSQDPPGEQKWIGAPETLNGFGFNSPTFFLVPGGANSIATSSTTVSISVDRDKVVYFTPQGLYGFQFGLSYTPDRTEELGGGLRPDNTPGQQSEVVEMAATWEGEVGDVGLGLFGAYAGADVEAPPPGIEDQEMWGAGASLTWAGFTVSGGYRWTDMGLSAANSDRVDWNAGLSYAWSLWRLSAAYGRTEAEAGIAGGEDTLDVVEAALRYTLGPGINLYAGGQYVSFEDNLGAPAAENRALLGVVGTRLSF